jgi:hypothetical protein
VTAARTLRARRGGPGKDRFLDGAGNQTCQRFAGADRIDAFAAADVIRLRGFGAAPDSLAEVLAAATDTGAGVLIQTSATSSILIAGVLVAALVADDFVF